MDVVMELQPAKPARSQGVLLSFEHLNYTVPSRKDKSPLNILSDVHGYFEPGKMAALMGPSGSGKTTLLDVLAGRKTVGSMHGTVLFGDQPASQGFLRRYTGYVEQFDTLLPTLTVREMLLYTAELKLPEDKSKEEKTMLVDSAISALRLDKAANTVIGDSMHRGISGGQAKRVNIGVSLVANPAVLFLDEPTSGLDSHTATEVMMAVKGLTNKGLTICATIHSPSAYTFRQFDTLLLLLDGRMAYFGDAGEYALQYFIGAGLADQPFNAHDNEAEWIVESTTKAAQRGDASVWIDYYQKSDEYKQNLEHLAAARETDKHLSTIGARPAVQQLMTEKRAKKGTTVSSWKAFTTLFKYRTLANFVNGEYYSSHVADKVMVVFILMTLFANKGDKTDIRGVSNVVGVLFLWVTLASFGASSYVPSLVMERPLFIRERNDGLYTVSVYLFSKILEELSLAAVATLLLSIATYFVVDLQGSFAVFWLAYFCTLSCGITAAYFIAAISPNIHVANAALPAYMVSLLYFSGLVMNLKSIPQWWNWYSHIDFVRYGFTALMANQFGDGKVMFTPQETVLEFYGMDNQSPWANLGYVVCFAAGFYVLTYLALKYIRHDKR